MTSPHNTTLYVPKIGISDPSAIDIVKLQSEIDDLGIAHARALDGRVWRIAPQIHPDGARLSHKTPVSPHQIPWDQVESLGRLEDPTGWPIPD